MWKMVFLFLMSSISLSLKAEVQLPFENGRYYYYTDVVGSYYFEFNSGRFVMYQTDGVPDELSMGEVPLPGYSGLFAKKTDGEYEIIKNGALRIMKIGNQRYVILYDRDIFVTLIALDRNDYTRQNIYFGCNAKYITKGVFLRPPVYSPEDRSGIVTSSDNTGGTTGSTNSPPPFGRIQMNGVWVSEKGDGKGWIEMEVLSPTRWLFLQTGIVDPSRYSEYLEFARPKSLKITYGDRRESIALKDSADPQVIDLGGTLMPGIRIRIEFLDSYPGARNAEIAVNFLGYLVNVSKELGERLENIANS